MSERYSLLPTNASALERAFERAFAELLEGVAPPFPELLDPTRTPVSALPYLAQDRGVVEWEGNASETLKRRTVQNVWPIRRLAGTRAGLLLAVDELDYDAEVLAWYDPKAYYTAPYSVELLAWKRNGATIDASVLEQMERNLAYAKSERDALTLTLALNLEMGFEVRAVLEPTVSYRDDSPEGQTFDPPTISTGLAPRGATGPATITLDDRRTGRIKASPDVCGQLGPVGALGGATVYADGRPPARIQEAPEVLGTLAPLGVTAPLTAALDLHGTARAPDPFIDLTFPGFRLAGAAYWTLITDHHPRAQT